MLRGCVPWPQAATVTVSERIGHVRGTTASLLAKLKMQCFPPNSCDGKAALSEFHVIETSESYGLSLVRVRIFSGRTHQIRLHAAHLGFPVLGDKLYDTRTPGAAGGSCCVDDAVYLERTRGQTMVTFSLPDFCGRADQWVIRRQLLHASRLRFLHPLSREEVDVRSDALPWFGRDCPETRGIWQSRV